MVNYSVCFKGLGDHCTFDIWHSLLQSQPLSPAWQMWEPCKLYLIRVLSLLSVLLSNPSQLSLYKNRKPSWIPTQHKLDCWRQRLGFHGILRVAGKPLNKPPVRARGGLPVAHHLDFQELIAELLPSAVSQISISKLYTHMWDTHSNKLIQTILQNLHFHDVIAQWYDLCYTLVFPFCILGLSQLWTNASPGISV